MNKIKPKVREIDIDNNFSIKIGTENKLNSKLVYINISTWISSKTILDENYIKKIIAKIRKDLFLFQEDDIFDMNKNFVVYQLRKGNINKEKKFFEIEINLIQDNLSKPLSFNQIINANILPIYCELIIESLKEDKYLTYSKWKKN